MLPYERDDYAALGICNPSGELIGGVVYDHFTGYDIAMHVAAVRGSMWMRPHIISQIFGFPFNQLKCRRVTGYVSARNSHTIKFDLGLGFQVEGRLRDATPEGDMIILGMTRNECRWLEENHGKVSTKGQHARSGLYGSGADPIQPADGGLQRQA
jgi:RimJ/RimL family protein N-acetyltransferase